jgi:hypothetical protein
MEQMKMNRLRERQREKCSTYLDYKQIMAFEGFIRVGQTIQLNILTYSWCLVRSGLQITSGPTEIHFVNHGFRWARCPVLQTWSYVHHVGTGQGIKTPRNHLHTEK